MNWHLSCLIIHYENRAQEERMHQGNGSRRLKTFLLITLTTILFLYLPLTAENNRENEQVLNKTTKAINDPSYNITYFTPLESKLSFNLELLFQHIDSKNNHLNNKLAFNPKKIEVNSDASKYFEKQIKLEKLENSLFTTSLVTLAALNVADYFSTKEALKCNNLIESNPIMKPFVKNDFAFAAVKIGLTAGNHFLMQKLYKQNRKLAWAVSLISNFAMSYIVANNIRLIHESQSK